MKKILLCLVLVFFITACGNKTLICEGTILDNDEIKIEESIKFVMSSAQVFEATSTVKYFFKVNVEENLDILEIDIKESVSAFDDSAGVTSTYFRNPGSIGVDTKLILDKLTLEEIEYFSGIAGLRGKTHSETVKAMNSIGYICR